MATQKVKLDFFVFLLGILRVNINGASRMISIGNISAGVIRNCFLRLKEETCTIVGNRGFGVGVWTWYLLLYNLAFILPLVLVFFIAWRGISTLQLIELSRNDVIIGKLAMAGFFLVMAGLMLSMQ